MRPDGAQRGALNAHREYLVCNEVNRLLWSPYLLLETEREPSGRER